MCQEERKCRFFTHAFLFQQGEDRHEDRASTASVPYLPLSTLFKFCKRRLFVLLLHKHTPSEQVKERIKTFLCPWPIRNVSSSGGRRRRRMRDFYCDRLVALRPFMLGRSHLHLTFAAAASQSSSSSS